MNEKAARGVFSKNEDQMLPVIEDGLEMQSICSQATILHSACHVAFIELLPWTEPWVAYERSIFGDRQFIL